MPRKGLLEWKILAGIFAVLIVVSSALVGSTGLKNVFLNSTTDLGENTQGSPLDWFSNLFATPTTGTSPVEIELIATNITLEMEKNVDVTIGDSNIEKFKGSIDIDFEADKIVLTPDGSSMVLDLTLEETWITGVILPKLFLKDIDFVVVSEKTNITASNDNIEIYDFSGDVLVTDSILLTGNATKVKDDKWAIG